MSSDAAPNAAPNAALPVDPPSSAPDVKEAKSPGLTEKSLGVPAESVTLTGKEGAKIATGLELVVLRTTPLREAKTNQTEGRVEGVVKNWLKGFGFVNVPDRTEDIFVHWKEIQAKGFRSLSPEDVVSFLPAQNKNSKPIAKAVRKISSLHLALKTPLPLDTKPGAIKSGSPITLIEHPQAFKRDVAPLKATVNGRAVGSVRKMESGVMYILFNRNEVTFTGLPNESYTQWKELLEHCPGIKVVTAKILVSKNADPNKEKNASGMSRGRAAKLKEHIDVILEHLGKTRAHSRSTRVSSLRCVLTKEAFNPKRFGFDKFKSFLQSIPEIEFINENKIRLKNYKGEKRKREEEGSDSKTSVTSEGNGGDSNAKETAAGVSAAKVQKVD